MSEHISALAQWARGWRTDLEALERALASDKVKADVRRYCAAALNYVVSRMDLVPDWEPVVGLFDDLMVVRICAAQALESIGPAEGDGGLDDKTTTDLGRLANQAERIREFLGADLFGRLVAYCDRLTREGMRGRTPEELLAEPGARAELRAEIEAAVARVGEIAVPDEDHASVRLKAYLGHKLK